MKKLLAVLMIAAMGIVVPNLADARHYDDRDRCSHCRGWGDCPKCDGKGYTEEYNSERKEFYEETCIVPFSKKRTEKSEEKTRYLTKDLHFKQLKKFSAAARITAT